MSCRGWSFESQWSQRGSRSASRNCSCALVTLCQVKDWHESARSRYAAVTLRPDMCAFRSSIWLRFWQDCGASTGFGQRRAASVAQASRCLSPGVWLVAILSCCRNDMAACRICRILKTVPRRNGRGMREIAMEITVRTSRIRAFVLLSQSIRNSSVETTGLGRRCLFTAHRARWPVINVQPRRATRSANTH
eukprot:COSAG02_NODE_3330_length_6923_cov_14.113277_10_plen_192_part_00